MKKYLFVLFLALGLLSVQNASAAITLTNINAGSVVTETGEMVEGIGNGNPFFEMFPVFSISSWKLDLDEAMTLDFNLSSESDLPYSSSLFENDSFFIPPAPVFSFSGSLGTAMLDSGTYYLTVFSGYGNVGIPYNLSIGPSVVSEVPVPAAVWLFGSALAGLIGVPRSKSQPKLAA